VLPLTPQKGKNSLKRVFRVCCELKDLWGKKAIEGELSEKAKKDDVPKENHKKRSQTIKTGPEAGQYFHVRPPIGFI